ncbi:DExH-box ATP-dependent RNA helicase DExH18, mitochondrial [Selaginella moellendorffii]|nr:DExH-box ATP-dependent RNA helicase DExH18, mitochondrial [Selaginella moellendorffii]|eukprot:XP_002967973.2 DExH-box ATP-dependent RNA helicase DExH18, mitochondrial [Selaginella moellendorffii]
MKALWRILSRHSQIQRQLQGSRFVHRWFDPAAVGFRPAFDASEIRAARRGFCTVVTGNGSAGPKRVKKVKDAAAVHENAEAISTKNAEVVPSTKNAKATKSKAKTAEVKSTADKKSKNLKTVTAKNENVGASSTIKAKNEEAMVLEKKALGAKKKDIKTSSTTDTKNEAQNKATEASQPDRALEQTTLGGPLAEKVLEEKVLGAPPLANALSIVVESPPASKKVETRRSGRRPNKQPEKLDLGKYFQAVGDDGDVFQEEELDLEKQKKVAKPALPEMVPEGFADPTALFQAMVKSPPLLLTPDEKLRLGAVLDRFAERGWAKTQALAVYINSKFFPQAVSKFRKFFTAKCPVLLKDVLLKVGPCDEAEEYLFPIFAEFCISEFSNEITRYRELVTSADLTKPHAWFPFTRAMKRKVIYHCGPTNSGKTYTALQRFLQAETGIYCCPLRLLAMEIYEKSNMSGVYCSLHTGQERREVPFATHLASTVEMAVLTKPWSVAVIDEVQMTADEFRGWAWTRAFLALRADEVHLCGDPSALELYKTLCAATCDEFVEHHYERFKPLTIDRTSAKGNFDFIEAGDCVVAFSRKEIFQVKLEIEQRTKHKCCVVYGALPPETRTQQAKLFNDPSSGYDVLVASDAIGMGLNLNIRRVIFNSLDKFNGEQRIPVPASQVKQIAGRAGRRGSLYPEGQVTTLYASDIPYLVECMKQPFEDAPSAGLFPVFEQLELFASQLPDITFSQLLDRFSEHCRLDGTYFLCKNDNLKKVAAALDAIGGLSLEDEYNFCFAPVNSRDPKSMGSLQRFASAYSRKIPVRLSMGMPQRTASDNAGIYDLETRHQLLSMYLWLSQHFPAPAFPERHQAAEMASKIAEMLGESLVLFTGEEARKRQEEMREREHDGGCGRESVKQSQSRLSLQMQTMRKQLCAA